MKALMKPFTLLLGAALLAAPLVASDPEASFSLARAEAAAALEAGEPHVAESRLRDARLEGYSLLGKLAAAGGDLEAARDALATASQAAVRRIHRPRTDLAVIYAQLGKETEALNRLRVLSELFRPFPEPWQKLVPLLVRSGRVDEARERLDDLHRLQPEVAASIESRFGEMKPESVPPLALDLGPVAELKKRELKKLRRRIEQGLEEVEAQLDELRRAPSQTEDLVAMIESIRDEHAEAVRDLSRGNPDDAVVWLRRAQKQGRGGPEVDRLLAFVRGAQSGTSVAALLQMVEIAQDASTKEPITLLGRAFEQAPSSEAVLYAYGLANLKAGLAHQARAALEPLAGIYPDKAEYHLLLGRTLVELNEATDAVEAFQEAVRRAPSSYEARFELGRALNGEKRYAEAKENLQTALGLQSDSLDAAAALAESEEGLGELEAAEKRAQSVLERRKDHTNAKFVLGMVRMKQDRYEEARDFLEDVVEVDPRSAQGHYQLSLACMRTGDRESAQHHLELYRRALEPQETLMEKAN